MLGMDGPVPPCALFVAPLPSRLSSYACPCAPLLALLSLHSSPCAPLPAHLSRVLLSQDYPGRTTRLAFSTSSRFLSVFGSSADRSRFHAWQSSLLFTAILVLHLLLSWSSFLSWVLFLCDLVLIGFMGLRAYQDADTLDR